MTRKSAIALGVDVGGTKTSAGLVEFPSGRIVKQQTFRTKPERGGAAVLEELQATLKELTGTEESIGVGVAVCELVDREGNISSSNLIDWTTAQVRDHLREFGPVMIEADVRAAALAEGIFGAGKGMNCFLYVTVGTGISSCLMLENKPFLGARGLTGTMASSPIIVPCGICGELSRLSLEEISSGPALVQRYNTGGGAARTGEEVVSAGENGDSLAARVIADASEALGSQVAIMVGTLDPEGVIIGGGLGMNKSIFWRTFVDATRRNIWSTEQRNLPIIQAKTGENAGLIGAASKIWSAEEQR